MHDVGFFVVRKACNVATSIWVTQAVIKQRGVQLPGVLTLLFTDHVVVFEVLTAFFWRDAAIFFYICFPQKGMLVFLWWLVLSGAPLCKDNKWVMRPDILPGNVLRTKEASGISKSAFKVACFIYVCVYICKGLWAKTPGTKGRICRMKLHHLKLLHALLYPCSVWQLEVVRPAAGFGNERVSSNPLRTTAAGTNCWARFTITVSLVLSLRCCWELLRRHCLELQGLPSHSLSSPTAGDVCPHVGHKSELGQYVCRQKLEEATGGWSSLGCAQPGWLRTPERLPLSRPQSLCDDICASSVFLQNNFVFDPTLYITGNFFLARRRFFSPHFTGL